MKGYQYEWSENENMSEKKSILCVAVERWMSYEI